MKDHNRLPEIDSAISKEIEKLTFWVENLHFEELFTFKLGECIPKIPAAVSKQQGIYFFEIANTDTNQSTECWIESFSQLWKNPDVTWVPGLKKYRVRAHQSLNDWIPLYIGKALNVGGRIFEHIFQERHKRTFSMKLNARSNLHGATFRISWIPLPVVNYHQIAPVVEYLLRNKFNPIVGKQ